MAMSEARIRTEDLSIDEVKELYVETEMDRENIEALKSFCMGAHVVDF